MELNDSIILHQDRLAENIQFLNQHFQSKNMDWTFVVKIFQDYPDDKIAFIADLPVAGIASENLRHLQIIKKKNPDIKTWFLNYQGVSLEHSFVDIDVTHKDVNLSHKTCLMMALDPEREGFECLPEITNQKTKTCFAVGAYLDCANVPAASFLQNWKKYNFPSTLTQSLGTSVSFEYISMLQDAGVNHYRLGELAFTGRSLLNQQKIKGMRQDIIMPAQARSYHYISTAYKK